MTQKTRTPNDQRSDAKNPNNRDFKAAQDNRSNQLNPNNKAFKTSRDHQPSQDANQQPQQPNQGAK